MKDLSKGQLARKLQAFQDASKEAFGTTDFKVIKSLHDQRLQQLKDAEKALSIAERSLKSAKTQHKSNIKLWKDAASRGSKGAIIAPHQLERWLKDDARVMMLWETELAKVCNGNDGVGSIVEYIKKLKVDKDKYRASNLAWIDVVSHHAGTGINSPCDYSEYMREINLPWYRKACKAISQYFKTMRS